MTDLLNMMNAPLAKAGLVGAGLCSVWLGSCGIWALRRTLRWRKDRTSFFAEAARHSISTHDAESLWLLSRFSPDGRLSILEKKQVFEDCVRHARSEAGDDLLSWPELLSDARVDALRRHYLPRRAAQVITQTRQLEINQPVTIHLPGGSQVNAFVMSPDAETLELSRPERLKLRPDSRVKITFSRPQDARYEFETRLAGDNGGTVALVHAPVTRYQQRTRVRVPCRQEISLAHSTHDTNHNMQRFTVLPALKIHATLKNLSAGGACFISEESFTMNEHLLMRLSAGKNGEAITLPARVVRLEELRGTSQPMHQAAVQFDPLHPQHEYYLARLVAKIQQGMIRRLLARIGEDDDAEPVSRPLVVRPAADVTHTASPEPEPQAIPAPFEEVAQ